MITIDIFLDKTKFNQFKNSVSDIEFETEILSFLQNIENKIACKNNRAPCFVVFEDATDIQQNGAYYDKNNEKIALIRSSFEPIEYITNLIHESNHANQEYSKNNTNKQQTANNISGWLYPVNNKRQLTINYTCNYLELLSKTEELKVLIDLYNQEKDNIEEYSTGKMFYQAFKNNYQHILSITDKNINKVLKNMIKIVRNPFTKVDKNIGLSKQEIIKFLKNDMRKLYREAYEKFKPIKENYFKNYEVLNNDYYLNVGNTILKYEKLKEENIRKQKENIQVIKSRINVKDIIDVDYTKESDTMFFENLNDYTNFLKNVKYPIFIISEDFQENKFQISFYMEDKAKSDEIQKTIIMKEKIEDKKNETTKEVQDKEIEYNHDEL